MKHWLAMLLAAAALLVNAVGAANGARDGFSGSVCGLVKTSQLATLHVTVPKCHAHPTLTNAGGVTYDAVWGVNKLAGAPRLNIGILKPANATMLTLIHHIKPALANGKTAANTQFVVGNYIVTINLSTPPSKPVASIAPFVALVKAVTAELS
jgi:hypothetical protein